MNGEEIKNLINSLEALDGAKFKAEGDQVQMSSCRIYSSSFKPENLAKRLNDSLATVKKEIELDIKKRLKELADE